MKELSALYFVLISSWLRLRMEATQSGWKPLNIEMDYSSREHLKVGKVGLPPLDLRCHSLIRVSLMICSPS